MPRRQTCTAGTWYLPPLLSIRQELDQAGVRLWLPDDDSVVTCVDKAAFSHVLAAHGIPTPPTFLPGQLEQVPDHAELVVKPRRGHGAQNVYFCHTREQARVLTELMPDAVIQPRLHGNEFTADCLVDRSGRPSVILRHRNVIKAGLAAVSSTFHEPAVADLVTRTLHAVRATGLCCVQGFVHHNGQLTITELNVRVAGGFALSEAAGADLVGQWVNGLFGEPMDHDRLTYKPGMFLTKYIETLAYGDTSTLPRTAVGRGTTA